MKKILIVIFTLLLTACKPSIEEFEQVEEFVFNDVTYVYSDSTSLGYDLFNGDGHLLEVKCDDECIISFELDLDIYIITGTSETFEITKNGSIITIDGKDKTPTGTELPTWSEDVLTILEAYKK